MENRLKLNKRPVYELPDEVLVGEYLRTVKVPAFKPDICLTSFGSLRIKEAKKTVKQIWVKTENKDLLDFISKYNWEDNLRKKLICQSKSSSCKFNLTVSRFKKIILEEFYNKRA